LRECNGYAVRGQPEQTTTASASSSSSSSRQTNREAVVVVVARRTGCGRAVMTEERQRPFRFGVEVVID
jgi:hypothetical protein